MNGRKILATLVILAMLMSTMVVLNKLEINIIENACATPGADEWGNATTDLIYNTTYASGSVKINTSKWASTGTYYLYYPTYICSGAGPNADSFAWNGPYKVGVARVKVVATQGNNDAIDTGGSSFSFNRSGMWIFDDDTTHNSSTPSSYAGYIWVNTSSEYNISSVADFEYGSPGTITITVDTGADVGCMISIVTPDTTTMYHKWRATGESEAIGIAGNFTVAGNYTAMAYRDFDEDPNVYLYADGETNYEAYNSSYGSGASFPADATYNYTNQGPFDPPEKNATNKRIVVLPGVPTTSIPEANATMHWGFPGQVNISVSDYYGNYIPGLNAYVFNSDRGNVTNNLTIYTGHSGEGWIWITSSSWGKDESYVYGENGTWYACIFKDVNGDGIEEWNTTVEWNVTGGQLVWVDDDFNSSTPGWNVTHFDNIQDGIDAVNESGTVYVYNGTYYENVVINKTINLIGEDKNTTVIDGGENGNVVHITADWVNISGFTIQNCGDLWYAAGVTIRSDFNTISKNVIRSNFKGISLLDSSCNNLLENNIVSSNFGEAGIAIRGHSNKNKLNKNIVTNNSIGILILESSSNNTVIDNDVYSNYGAGIQITYLAFNNNITSNVIYDNTGGGGRGIITTINSTNNRLTDNLLVNNSIAGIALESNSNNNIVINNTIIDSGINGIDVYTQNNVIMNNHISNSSKNGLYFSSSNNNTISGNIVSLNNGDGIYLELSSTNTFSGNNITSNNLGGIVLQDSSNNNITGNNITSNNNKGIALEWYSSNNIIYHNNFINNTQNAYDEGNNTWDNGYPSGGNYWDDYNGTDADGDGIGDTPYDIPGNGDKQDRYPLMFLYGEESGLKIITPEEGFLYIRSLKIFPLFTTLILGNIKIKVNAANYIYGINLVEFYVDGRLRKIDQTPPYEWRWRLSSHIKHRHTIEVVAYDSEGNHANDTIEVWKFF